MNDIRINTSIKLNGMDELKELLSKQQELFREISNNVAKIEMAASTINLELSIERRMDE